MNKEALFLILLTNLVGIIGLIIILICDMAQRWKE